MYARLPPSAIGSLPRYSNDNNDINNNNNNNKAEVQEEQPGVLDKSQAQVMRPSSQQQVSPPSEALQAGRNPPPLQAPQSNRHLVDLVANNDDAANNEINNSNKNNANDNSLPNEPPSNIRFESRDGNIVPAGPNEHDQQQQGILPLPYDQEQQPAREPEGRKLEVEAEVVEQPKQVLLPPLESEANSDDNRLSNGPSSKDSIAVEPLLKPRFSHQFANDKLPQAVHPNDFDWPFAVVTTLDVQRAPSNESLFTFKVDFEVGWISHLKTKWT